MIIFPLDKVARVRPLQHSSDKEVEKGNVFPTCDTEPCGSSLHPISGLSSLQSYSFCNNQTLNLATCFHWPAQKTRQYCNNQWSIRIFYAKQPPADCVPAPGYSLSTRWWAVQQAAAADTGLQGAVRLVPSLSEVWCFLGPLWYR